jgi:hypothetical protein
MGYSERYATIICAGLACVDMQLNQATGNGSGGGESIETFEGEGVLAVGVSAWHAKPWRDSCQQ